MKKNNPSILSVGFVAFIGATIPLGTQCRAGEPKSSASVVREVTPVYTTDETKQFKTLAKETITALDAAKITEMAAKLTDLETAWDDKEEALKPKDPATWTLLDKTLDKAISALRSSRTDMVKGKAALVELVTKLEQATKP